MLVTDLSSDDHEDGMVSHISARRKLRVVLGRYQLWTASQDFRALSPTLIGPLVESVDIPRGVLYLAVVTLVVALLLSR